MRLRSSLPPLPRLLFLVLLRPLSPSSTRRFSRSFSLSTLTLPPSATATPSPSSAPEPSIRLFARNRFHVFGPLLHLYKRARTTNISHCARRHGRFALRARLRPSLLRPRLRLHAVLVLGCIVARLPLTVSISGTWRSLIGIELLLGLLHESEIAQDTWVFAPSVVRLHTKLIRWKSKYLGLSLGAGLMKPIVWINKSFILR